MSTDINFQDQSMPVQTLAVNWYEAAIDTEVSEPTKDYFRFMAIWLGFSALYESFACSDKFSLMEKTGDRKKLKPAHKVWTHYLEKKTNIRQRHNYLRKNNPEYQDAVNYLALGVHKMSRLLDGIDLVEGRKIDARNPTVKQIMHVINVIRNNVFHGYKEPTNDERDNKLVRSAHLVLVKLLSEEMEEIKSTWFVNHDIEDD